MEKILKVFNDYRVIKKSLQDLRNEGWKNILSDLNRNSYDDFNFSELCRAFLVSLGYRFDPVVKMWFNLDFGGHELNSKYFDALSFVFLKETQDLVFDWAFSWGFIEYRIYNRWEYGWFFDKEKFDSYLKENDIRL